MDNLIGTIMPTGTLIGGYLAMGGGGSSVDRFVEINFDQQTMQLDKTAGEINDLVNSGKIVLLMGRQLFIEEYDDSTDTLTASFYIVSFISRFTIVGNQVTDIDKVDYAMDNSYVHTDNNFTNAEKTKLAGLENKIITVNADQQTLQLDKSADEIENYLNNGYIVMALGYQVFRKDYNASTHTIQLAIFFGAFGQVITVVGNQVTNVQEYYYASDPNYVHTDNNFTTTYKDKLDTQGEIVSGNTGYVTGGQVYDYKNKVVDLSSYSLNDTITNTEIIQSLLEPSAIVNYNGSYLTLSTKDTQAGLGDLYYFVGLFGESALVIVLLYTNNIFVVGAIETIGIQLKSNLVTSISSSSTHTQYPSAKCVYDMIGNIETILNTLNSGGGAS